MNVSKNGVTDNNKHQTLVPESSSSSKLISLGNHFKLVLIFIYDFEYYFLKRFCILFLMHFSKGTLVIFG